MLIIFDLDDTLIETSKCLTPYYLQRVHANMGGIGSLEELNRLSHLSLTSKEAIVRFWELHSSDSRLLEKGLSALKEPIPDGLILEQVPDCLEVLNSLQETYLLGLVTKGDPSLQMQKVEKAGIQPSYFSKLVVSTGPSKKSDYQNMAAVLQKQPSEVIVCGDRIAIDLTPAKELGFSTIHFENGKGKSFKEPKADVDLSITELKELLQVCQNYESKSSLNK